MIPRDKLQHVIVGLLVAVFLVVLLIVEQRTWPSFFAQHVAFFAVLNGGVVVHVAKEGGDWLDNRNATRSGLPTRHGVELLDALAGQVGTTVIALLGLWAGLL